MTRPRIPTGVVIDTTREGIFISPPKFEAKLLLALAGTRIQISQTNEGVPLGPNRAMSYVDFNELLNSSGVEDRVFDVPVGEQGIGDLAMAAIVAMTGGITTAYEVRFKVNGSPALSALRMPATLVA